VRTGEVLDLEVDEALAGDRPPPGVGEDEFFGFSNEGKPRSFDPSPSSSMVDTHLDIYIYIWINNDWSRLCADKNE
jgi:hypothetical protein